MFLEHAKDGLNRLGVFFEESKNLLQLVSCGGRFLFSVLQPEGVHPTFKGSPLLGQEEVQIHHFVEVEPKRGSQKLQEVCERRRSVAQHRIVGIAQVLAP